MKRRPPSRSSNGAANIRLRLALLVFAAIAAWAPAGALAWTPARPLVRERQLDPVTLRLAVGNDGRAVFAWLRGPFGYPRSPGLVQARLRSPSGRLSRIRTLRRMRLGHEGLPQVAIGPRGAGAVVWLENAARGPWKRGHVYASVRAGRRFGPAVRVGASTVLPEGGSGAGAQGDSPKVAIDPRGGVLVFWEHDRGSLQYAWKPAGHRFQTPKTIPTRVSGTRVDASQISLAFDGRGNAYATWSSPNVVVHGQLLNTAGVWFAERRAHAARFRPPRLISPLGTMVGEPRLAVARNGTVAVIWTQPTEFSYPSGEVNATIRRPGGAFSPAQAVSGGCSGVSPQVAASPTGQVVAVWVGACGGAALTGAASSTGSAFGPLEPVSVSARNTSEFGYLDLAVMGAGEAVAAFSPDARVSVRPPGGPFGAPELIASSSIATTPHVAAAGRLAIVGWQGAGGFYYSTLTR
jgi:hypothetical protein